MELPHPSLSSVFLPDFEHSRLPTDCQVSLMVKLVGFVHVEKKQVRDSKSHKNVRFMEWSHMG